MPGGAGGRTPYARNAGGRAPYAGSVEGHATCGESGEGYAACAGEGWKCWRLCEACRVGGGHATYAVGTGGCGGHGTCVQ